MMQAEDLFVGPAPRLFTVPAGSDFLGDLSKTLIAATGAKDQPDALADGLIYVPNRRSARVLAFQLYQDIGSKGFLPPEIRPLGDLADDEDVVSAEAALAGLGPAPSSSERLGALARLVQGWYQATGRDLAPASALAAAQDLASLLDQAALAGGVDWTKLPDLVTETDLAGHWQQSVEFLEILTEHWPLYLEQNGQSEPYERRARVAEAMAERWLSNPPDKPVIIAGSTGTTPASRTLMMAAARLPKGAVVFPGLETDLSEAAWQAIGRSPSHPQFAFVDTLRAFGVAPSEVFYWPGADQNVRYERRRLIAESLAPADETKDWIDRLDALSASTGRSAFVETGLEGLSLIEASDQPDEARQAALLMRETLEHPGRTAALVTPDVGLARRVSTLLRRWNVTVHPSAGEPLLQTSAASFVGLVLDWFLRPQDPVRLAAMIKHPFFRMECKNSAQRERFSVIERASLRGPIRWESFEGLCDRIERDIEELRVGSRRGPVTFEIVSEALPLLHSLREKWRGVWRGADPEQPTTGRAHAEKIAELASVLAVGEDGDMTALWAGRDGAATAKYLEEFADTTDALGPLDAEAVPDLFHQLARNVMVPGDPYNHPRLFIWGPLEARLQRCDLMILGGLNEESWPARPAVDGFLPRQFRSKLGLSDPEARVGLSAHDFAQLACAPEVVLLRSKRSSDAPTVASRWVWRLQTLVGGALSPDAAKRALHVSSGFSPAAIAEQMDHAPLAVPLAAPAPRPPISVRPKRLSVTQITSLIRDPYSIFARHILKLDPLKDLGAAFGPSEIGTAVHKALEHFDATGENGLEPFMATLQDTLRDAGMSETEIRAREPLDWQSARYFLDWRQKRAAIVDHRYFEKHGVLDVELNLGEKFRLSGRVDLLERLKDGTASIVDFKTGSAPTEPQVATGLEPQLSLMAAMAQAGGFDEIAAIEPSDLIYFEFRPKGGEKAIRKKTTPEYVESTLEGVANLLAQFGCDETAYFSKPRTQFLTDYGDFDRLARRAEWLADPEGSE